MLGINCLVKNLRLNENEIYVYLTNVLLWVFVNFFFPFILEWINRIWTDVINNSLFEFGFFFCVYTITCDNLHMQMIHRKSITIIFFRNCKLTPHRHRPDRKAVKTLKFVQKGYQRCRRHTLADPSTNESKGYTDIGTVRAAYATHIVPNWIIWHLIFGGGGTG